MGKIVLLVSREEMLFQAHNILQEKQYEIQEMKVVRTEDTVMEARQIIAGGATIIIARGLQASLIKQYTDIPVVEIVITAQEMGLLVTRAKQILKKQRPRIAVVGFKNMFSDMTYFDTLYDIELTAYYAGRDVSLHEAAAEAVADGAELIIGGDTAVEAASAAGVPSLFLSTTEDSIRTAFSVAERMDFAMGAEKRNAAQMETLLDYSTNGVMRLDGTGTILSANPMMEQMMGREERQVTGKKLWEVFPETEEDGLKRALETGTENYSCFLRMEKNAYLADLAPIVVDGRAEGAVFTCTRIKPRRAEKEREKTEKTRWGLRAAGDFGDLLQKSPAMQECLRKAKLYSLSDSPIVIEGECGTEKWLLAQCIHSNGMVSSGPFLRVDCGTVDAADQPSLIFGENGAAARAEGGTLFLDGAERLCLAAQDSLCQLVERHVRRGGDGLQETRADVRLILASEVSLAELAREGKFLRELFFAAGGLLVRIPPLRERPEDLTEKLEQSLKAMCGKYSRYHVLTAGAKKALERYTWPGNLVQAESFMERLILTAGKRSIDEDMVNGLLAELYPHMDGELRLGDAVKGGRPDRQKLAVEMALEEWNGSREKAAQALGISKATLWRWMKKYGLE